MQQKVTVLNIGKGRTIRIPVNYQHFILDYSNSPEGHGWNRDDVIYILQCIKEGHVEDLDMDDNLMNDIRNASGADVNARILSKLDQIYDLLEKGQTISIGRRDFARLVNEVS